MNLRRMPVGVMVMSACVIRPSLGLEGHGDAGYRRAEAAQHFLQDMVLRDSQESLADLDGHVAVAEMIGASRQVRRRRTFDVQHALAGRDHLDDATVGGDDEVADLMIETVNTYAPNFKQAVLGRQVFSPLASMGIDSPSGKLRSTRYRGMRAPPFQSTPVDWGGP